MSQPGQQKSKELKISTKQVITPSAVKEDKRKIQLLFIIRQLNSISEKGLTYLLKELKERNLDLGYNFIDIGGNLNSPDLKEDIMALLYLGFVESDPTKKLKLTTNGIEFLESSQIDDDFKNKINQILQQQELKTKINAIDAEYSLKLRRERRMLRR